MSAWHHRRAAHAPSSAGPSAPAGGQGAACAAPRPDPGFVRGAIIGLVLVVPFWTLVALGIWRLLR